ncbi:MAG: hypothetical protein M1836_006213 [Candelina mexicana]|nr:MAG: hypothetical protein M1836_006213 [Candelina mexicana]
MTRTLPWLKQSEATTKRTRRDRPAKRQKLSGQDSDDDVARPAQRTPSTSPPPEPPSEEFMREGLDHDDIYIMVEDEFQTVARRFTQHLHHAEYLRLKNLAKSQNASAILSLSRPVDSRTTMRQETRKKIEAESKQKDLKNAVQQVMSGADANGKDELDSDLDDDKEDDPWVGTSLHSLMASPRKSQSSLTRVARIKSGSRAAAGYAKAKATPAPEVTTYSIAQSDVRTSVNQGQADQATTSEDDDDLDAPTRARRGEIVKTKTVLPPTSQIPPRSNKLGGSLFAQFSQPKKPPDRARADSVKPYQAQASAHAPADRSGNAPTFKPVSRLQSKTPTLPSQSFDDLPQTKTKPNAISHRIGKRMAELRAEKLEKEREPKRKATSLNEIPTFLV